MAKKIYSKNRVFINIVILIIAMIFMESFFFRSIWNFDALISDNGDGLFCTLIAEHWYRFFCGKESFWDLSFFYPAENILGYSDMLLGYGIIHSVFRTLGCNMYISYKYTVILIHVVGTISMCFLLKCKIKLNVIPTLVGVSLFSFSNAYCIGIEHTQMATISILPLMLIALFSFFQNLNNRCKRNIAMFMVISLYGFILYTAWYVAFFTALFCVLFVIVYAFITIIKKYLHFRDLRCFISVLHYDMIGYFIYFIATLIPFALVYLPTLSETGERQWSDVFVLIDEPIDIINVSSENWLFGWAVKLLGLENRPDFTREIALGFSPFAFILLIAFAFFYYRYYKGVKTRIDCENILIFTTLISFIIGILIGVRLSREGVSLWYLVYKFVPGGSSIRAVGRWMFFLSFPMAILVALLMQKKTLILFQKKRNDRSRAVIKIIDSVLLLIVFFSNINIRSMSYWNATEQMEYMDSVQIPPENCEVFYIIDSSDTELASPYTQTEAASIAYYFDIKTLNGYSGNAPSGWNLGDIYSDSYEEYVLQWILSNDIDVNTVYSYDRAKNTWKQMEVEATEVLFSEEGIFSALTKGLCDFTAGEYYWTDGNFTTVLDNSKIANEGLRIKLLTVYDYYLLEDPDSEPYLKLYVNDEYIQDIDVVNGWQDITVQVPVAEDDIYTITLESNAWFCPRDIGLNEDTRQLSFGVNYIGN